MSDPTCPVVPGDHVPEHEQHNIVAQLPVYDGDSHARGLVYPCAVPGISLTNYSLNAQQKGWGAHCVGPFKTITFSNGVRITVDARIAELVTLLMNETIRRGYVVRQADTGAYVCRFIAGTTIWSNHAWGLAVDIDWGTNPQKSPLTTDEPVWMRQLWNRYGFAWGGDYVAPTRPDAMHHEFMGTPAQAVVATALARKELGAAPPAPPTPATPGNNGFLPDRHNSPVTGNAEVPGADFSYAKPAADALARAGMTFVMGYVSPTATKNLSSDQMGAYRALGLGVGLVWEASPTRTREGAAAGTTDGAEADRQATALGYPTDAVIFAAVDYDAPGSDFPAIATYLAAFNQATSRPVGVYGKADVLDAFVTPGVQPVRYGWQTAAWSGGRLSAKANLYQRTGHPGWPSTEVAAGDYDEDVAILPVPLHGWLTKPAPVIVPPPPKPVPTINPNGVIAATYNALPQAWRDRMGALVVGEHLLDDGVGYMAEWTDGCILFHPGTGAKLVWGGICGVYKDLGAEMSPLGYPVSHELAASTPGPDGAMHDVAVSLFEHGAIVWYLGTPDHAVLGP